MGDIGRVRVVFSYGDGSPGMATHFFRVDGATSWADQKQPILDDVNDAYELLIPAWPTGLEYTVQDQVDIIDEETGELVTTVTGTGAGGTGVGTQGFAPLATGVCITWRTNGVVDGAHVRGRTFIVPIGNEHVDTDGTPTSGLMDVSASFAAALIATDGGNADLVIWSRPRAARPAREDPPRPARPQLDGSAYTVQSATISDQFAVLRSRRD